MAWKLDLHERAQVNKDVKYSGYKERLVYELTEEEEKNEYRFVDFRED